MNFPKPVNKSEIISKKESKEGPILEEEEYIKNLETIIRRDFFPDLHRIEQIKQGTFDDGKNLNLNNFLNTYNSEDNHSFGQILEKQHAAWKAKYWWIFKNKENQLPELKDDEQKNKMIEMEKNKVLMLTNYEGENLFLFAPQNKQLQTYTDLKDLNSGITVYENTRLENPNLNLLKSNLQFIGGSENGSSKNDINNNIRLQTPDLLGFKRKENSEKINLDELLNNKISETNSMTKNISFASEVNGYDLLKLPSPSPADFKSPLMTWGEVETTPLRLDKANYSIPKESKKDLIHNRLTNSFLKKKKISKKITETRIKNLLTTPHRLNSELSGFGNSIRSKSGLQDLIKSKNTPAAILKSKSKKNISNKKDNISQEQKIKDLKNKIKKLPENLLKI